MSRYPSSKLVVASAQSWATWIPVVVSTSSNTHSCSRVCICVFIVMYLLPSYLQDYSQPYLQFFFPPPCLSSEFQVFTFMLIFSLVLAGQGHSVNSARIPVTVLCSCFQLDVNEHYLALQCMDVHHLPENHFYAVLAVAQPCICGWDTILCPR